MTGGTMLVYCTVIHDRHFADVFAIIPVIMLKLLAENCDVTCGVAL
jgi:hypothetical protein